MEETDYHGLKLEPLRIAHKFGHFGNQDKTAPLKIVWLTILLRFLGLLITNSKVTCMENLMEN